MLITWLTSLIFVRGIYQWPVDSPHKGPVTWKMFQFHDVIMTPKNLTKWLLGQSSLATWPNGCQLAVSGASISHWSRDNLPITRSSGSLPPGPKATSPVKPMMYNAFLASAFFKHLTIHHSHSLIIDVQSSEIKNNTNKKSQVELKAHSCFWFTGNIIKARYNFF